MAVADHLVALILLRYAITDGRVGSTFYNAKEGFSEYLDSTRKRNMYFQRQRHLPFFLRISCLFGGVQNQVGWALVLFSTFFVWGIALNGDYGSLIVNYNQTVDGYVTDIRSAGFSEGSSRSSSKRMIYQMSYRYIVDGKEFHGKSYSSSQYFTAGKSVAVQYSSSNPAVSRIRGTRANIFPAWVAFIFIFPAIGLGIVYFGIKRGWRAIELLREGVLTKGKLVERQNTNMTINNRPVIKYTFEFKAYDGRTYRAHEKTHAPREILDESEEAILYSPADPNIALLIDNLPSKVKLDQTGQVLTHSRGLYSLALPVLCITVIAWLLTN